jgi:acyl-ACP thioesterase
MHDPPVAVDAILTELVPRPPRGRTFSAGFRPGLADCAPGGRLRLDGLARWLQEVAYADVEDAQLHFHAVWVVRRTRISVRRFPRFADHCTAVTFCSGLGRMWAERRTTISIDGVAEPAVEAVSLWVHLEPGTWRPTGFSDAELAVYSEAASGRRITARLRHPAPDGADEAARWRFRACDCDIAGHVNNAAYLQVLEEQLLLGDPPSAEDPEPGPLELEIEYRTPAQPGDKLVLMSGPRCWIAADDGDVNAAAILLT